MSDKMQKPQTDEKRGQGEAFTLGMQGVQGQILGEPSRDAVVTNLRSYDSKDRL